MIERQLSVEEAARVKISVIIPTYNRREELKTLLYSLNRQTLPPAQFEIIIVDDGSCDGTEEWLMSHKDQFTAQLSFFSQDHGGPGAARNTGMQKARGDIFAFTDTDCITQPDWLERITEPFGTDKVGAVGGSEIINEGDPLRMRCFHYLMTSPLTTGGLRGKKGKKLARFYPRTFNMALARNAYAATGGFKPWFHAEDIEFSYRIKQKGFDLVYQDAAQVYHRRRNTLAQFIGQIFHMGKARFTLYQHHPASLEPLHLLPTLALLLLPLLLLLSIVWPPGLTIFTLCLGAGFLYLASVALHSCLTLRSLKALFFVPLCFLLQQGAYGSGFLISAVGPKSNTSR